VEIPPFQVFGGVGMKVLLVGAGAVGQVYGRHLQRGGADVSFLVKERHAEELRRGLTLYAWNEGRPPAPADFRGFGVLTGAAEAGRERWDQVWLCISSTALRGPWLDELLPAIGEATLVALQPGLEDREYLLARWPAERLVCGAIALISYQAPLPGEIWPRPGVAYWFPPLSPSPFSGPREKVLPVVEALRRGGCPAREHPDVPAWSAVPSAIMMPALLALEAEGWSLRALRRGSLLTLAASAARETLAIVAARQRKKPALLRHVLGPWTLSALLAVAPRVMPFDFEAYLRYHFTKVGDQTVAMVATYVETARAQGLPHAALDELAARAAARRKGLEPVPDP
jgi:ketopantoate reductase